MHVHRYVDMCLVSVCAFVIAHTWRSEDKNDSLFLPSVLKNLTQVIRLAQ